ncbi:MAG: EamA family transporter, partial [Planctomycetota bacterium]
PLLRAPDGPSRITSSFAVGVLLALLAALAVGLALPLGRHRFDDVGVWPGAFIRLAGGAFGALPLAALAGLRRGTTPSAEVASLVEPLFRVPGPSSVWGRTALTGVGVAILGLIPYHYALRELPSGIASILFATTPLFTLPLSLLVRQRVGIAAALGSIIGFTGVAGVLLVENAASIERDVPVPVDALVDVIPLSIDAPEGARFPTFVVDAERPVPGDGAPELPALVAVQDPEVAAADDVEERPPALLLLGFDDFAGPDVQSVLDGLGPESAAERLHVHFANLPAAARLSSGGLVFAHPERLGEATSTLDAGVRLSLADGGPPLRGIGWLGNQPELAVHGFTTLVAGDPGGSVVAVWLDERGRAPAANAAGDAPLPGSGNVQLRARAISPVGAAAPDEVVDGRVARSCPTDGVRLSDGTLLLAYRNLGTDDEVDIAIARREPSGVWRAPAVVHADGWRFNGPLVNGPAIAAEGDLVAVAWYVQLGEGQPAVRVAFSDDAGRTFGAPRTLFEGRTRGQVELASVGDGLFALTHESPPADGSDPGQLGAWQVVVVAPGAIPTDPIRVGALLGRSSGRLDLVEGPPGVAFAAWTGPTGLEAARITVERPENPSAAPSVDSSR